MPPRARCLFQCAGCSPSSCDSVQAQCCCGLHRAMRTGASCQWAPSKASAHTCLPRSLLCASLLCQTGHGALACLLLAAAVSSSSGHQPKGHLALSCLVMIALQLAVLIVCRITSILSSRCCWRSVGHCWSGAVRRALPQQPSMPSPANCLRSAFKHHEAGGAFLVPVTDFKPGSRHDATSSCFDILSSQLCKQRHASISKTSGFACSKGLPLGRALSRGMQSSCWHAA